MSLNVTINGYLYNSDGSINTGDGYYQFLFYRNGTASSPDKWNSVRQVEPGTGYFNANLGDSDFLTPTGTALANSKIVLVFWRGAADRNAACSQLVEWGATEITYDGSSSVYSLDVQVRPNILPNLVWSLPVNGFLGTVYTASNSSYDVHNWVFGQVTMYHWLSRYGYLIQSVNSITTTEVDWGDDTIDTYSGVYSPNHSWTSTGVYDVVLSVYDECGGVVSGTKQITINNKAPTVDITCIEAVGTEIVVPNTVVTFKYSGNDPDDSITKIEWVIEDATNTTYTSTDKNEIVYHTAGTGTFWCYKDAEPGAFTLPGDHTVYVRVHWFDGFNSNIIEYSETFKQKLFSGPNLDFIQDPSQAIINSPITFTNNSTNVDMVGKAPPDCVKYNWYYNDNGVETSLLDVPYGEVFSYTPTTVSGVVTLEAYWSDGYSQHIAKISKDVTFATTVLVTPEQCYYSLYIEGTSTGGTADAYSWEIYKDESAASDGSGPWELVWYSPVNIEQQYKKICFTALSYYKIVGYVHGSGNPTSDYDIVNIDIVCKESPQEDVTIIWNGTGEDDVGGDWDHSGFGIESPAAKYSGTNGLEVIGFNSDKEIVFSRSQSVDTTAYDLLVGMINILSDDDEEDVKLLVKFNNGKEVNLLRFIGTHDNDYSHREWVKFYVPLTEFNLTDKHLNKLTFYTNRRIDFYLDDLEFAVGVVKYVPVHEYDIDSDEVGKSHVVGDEIKPSIKAKDHGEHKPRISAKDALGLEGEAEEIKPSMKVKFPKPY